MNRLKAFFDNAWKQHPRKSSTIMFILVIGVVLFVIADATVIVGYTLHIEEIQFIDRWIAAGSLAAFSLIGVLFVPIGSVVLGTQEG